MFVSHPDTTIMHHINDSSTMNLHKHAVCCTPEDSAAATNLKTWAHRNTYTCEDFHVGVVSWVVNKCHPFTIIEDQELCSLFCMLDPQVKIPSWHSVQCDIMHLYDITQKKLSGVLKVSYYTPCHMLSYCTYYIRHTPELYMLALMAGHHMPLWHFWVRLPIGSWRAVRALSRLSLTLYGKLFFVLSFSTNTLSF